MGTWKDVPLHDVRPGDWATHVNGELDPREVASVWLSPPYGIQLWLLTDRSGELPRENYTYRRYVPSAAERKQRRYARDERLASLPWVRELSSVTATGCEAVKWSAMSFKRLREWRTTGEVPTVAKCKREARWRLTSVARPRRKQGEFSATPGAYCTTHLLQQIHNHEAEMRRYRRHVEKES